MPQRTIWLVGVLAISMFLALLTVLSAAGDGAQASPEPTPTLMPVPDPVLGALDLEDVARLDLHDYPVIPEIGEHARAIYLDGLGRGADPHAFVKVGDCMTQDPEFPYFLTPIGAGQYDLERYADLQPVIDHFSAGALNSFARQSQAAAGGFNSASVLDALWANPEFCQAGETPLACEFRHMQPSIALVMFGTNDVYYLDEVQFDFFLRSIVVETIHNGTLPILSTFPERPEFPEKSLLYNQIVVQIAQDYDVPLINLWLALEDLPNRGVNPEDTTHMTIPADGAVCVFSEENLQTGFAVRNLVTLQTLQAVLEAASHD